MPTNPTTPQMDKLRAGLEAFTLGDDSKFNPDEVVRLLELFTKALAKAEIAALEEFKTKIGLVGHFDRGGDGPSTWTILEAIGEMQQARQAVLSEGEV